MGDDYGTDIVHLATAPSEVEGMMWRDAIRAGGITVMMRPGGPGMGGWASSATFEHVLYVREADYEEARDILDRFMAAGASGPSVARARRGAPRVRRRSLRRPG
jgi:hypothetical protein